MQKTERMHNMCKAIGLFCAIVMLVCALYVPLTLSASALSSVEITDDVPFVFDFENTADDVLGANGQLVNKNEALGASGIGYYGWGPKVMKYTGDEANAVLRAEKSDESQPWVTSGGYRLHTKKADGTYGVYELKTRTRYLVSFKIRVIASPYAVEGSVANSKAMIYLGYNSSYDSSKSGQEANYVNGMTTKIPVASSVIDSNTFSLYDTNGKTTGYNCSEEWYEVKYLFTTSVRFTDDPVLAFWADTYTGFQCEIDDVSVVRVGSKTGIVTFVDDYSGIEEDVFGDISSVIALPDISNRAQSAEHVFEGWYLDEARTQKAENLKYTSKERVLYARWKAPVTITFKDTFNGTESKVSGLPGEAISFPSEPVDAANNNWFMAWYTDEAYTTKFTAEKFGYTNITVYSFFKGRIPGIQENFENYDKDAYTVMVENGQAYKSNYLNFATTMKKQGEVTYNDSKYAIKFHWNPVQINDKNNENYYDTSRYAATDNYFNIGTGLQNEQRYVVTFKYKAEKVNSPVNFYMISGADENPRNADNRTVYPFHNVTLEQSDEWQEMSYQFTTDLKAGGYYMYFGVSLTNNEETIIYFDEITVEAFAQPCEGSLKLHTNINNEVIYIKGNPGEQIVFPEISHPLGVKVSGWYTDEGLYDLYESTTYEKGEISLYAKWPKNKGFIQDFENYSYDEYEVVTVGGQAQKSNRYIFATPMKKQSDVTFNGEYAVKFDWNPVPINDKKDENFYSTSRYNQLDNYFHIGDGLDNNQLYSVSFKYKVEKGDQPANFYLMSAGADSGWNARVVYPMETFDLKPTDGWQEYTFEFTTNMSTNGSTMYLGIALTENEETVVYFDDIVVKNELCVVFMNDGYDSSYGSNVVKGKVGDEIKYPEAIKIGYDFVGWYLDPDCTIPFELKVFEEDTVLTVYAKWTVSTSSTYSFENYTCTEEKGFTLMDGEVSDAVAKKGKYSLRFGDRTPGNYEDRSYFVLEDGTRYHTIEYDRQYVVTINYYIKEYAASSMNFSFYAAVKGNIFTGANSNKGLISDTQSITYSMAKELKGKWNTMSFAIDTTGITDLTNGQALDGLYIMIRGGEYWDIYFDEITVTEVPKGKSLVVIDTQGAKISNSYIIGSEGASYASKVPESLSRKDMYFKGYFTKSADGTFTALERDKMKFEKGAMIVYARFFDYEVNEDFDGGFYGKANGNGLAYSIHDFDYEVYDAEKEGNSKANVTSGRYSLHRKGDSMFNENSVILTLGNQIAESERYTVTFKVKMGKHLHTDGAIKIVSSRSFEYAWTTTGDYYPVVAIADLADGQWHEVSYTFNSVEAFLTIQTPGYVELFMDDFKFALIHDDTPVSTPISYTEYVPAERDADGNLLMKDRTAIDISTIIDDTLFIPVDFPWLWVIIGGAVALVLIAGAIVVTIVLVKKKKKSKA